MRHVFVRRFFVGLLATCLLAIAGIALADDTSLYEGSVLVNNQGEGEKAGAEQRALLQVIVKLTGQRNAASLPEVRGLLGSAGKMVIDSHFTADSETINGAPIYRQRLVVQFDHSAVDALIAGSGLPTWPAPRAPVVLWLVIDDGHGPRLVGSAHTSVVKSLTDRANDRGLGFVLPAGTPVESQIALLASGVGPAQAVVLPSAAYGPMQLIGRLTRTTAGWNAQWALLDGGIEAGRWSETNPDARVAMANAADGAADALAKKYAKVVAGGPSGTFTVEIDGLHGSEDYVRAMGYLEGIGIVRKIVLLSAKDDRLRMQLDLSTGMEGFRSVIAVGQVLEPDVDPASTVFHLHP
ncbi:MAG TPA: DUF2066 domain-containing protein [Xanthomonadaceae bacterium]|jgi:hypothetical protein|nr:DUF2066 domain-containing protein [Xanthomonadaceae bacterium]